MCANSYTNWQKTMNTLALKSVWPAIWSWTLSTENLPVWKSENLWFSKVIFNKKVRASTYQSCSNLTPSSQSQRGFLLIRVAPACPLSHMCFSCTLSVTCQNWSGSLRSFLGDRRMRTRPTSRFWFCVIYRMKAVPPSLCSQDEWLQVVMMRFLKV